MKKARKTRKEKIKTTERVHRAEGFVISEEWLKTKSKDSRREEFVKLSGSNKYFKADLTKTLILTMLVLALEIAIWQYLTRQ